MSSSSYSSSSSSSSSLEPTLYTILPESLHSKFVSHLSLNSIHIEELEYIDRIYVNSNPIIQGQLRNLRFRSRKLKLSSATSSSSKKNKNKGRTKENVNDQWIHTLSYISSPLKSQEYSQATTRAVIGLNNLSLENTDDIQDFVESLGFEHSHTYQQKGQLFYIPLSYPTSLPITLQLSITHLTPLNTSSASDNQQNLTNNPSKQEPWLIQLYPSRPVNAVSINGDVNYSNLVELMKDFVDRLGVQGLDWSITGR
ncbi:uncharacterized protein L201_006037 [Kwoniella dendrophila CBS 6074]|uniref:Mediator of RNA polymerase II transcription subunit 18 n=1 Tax=Kwoniella dendrophila CBS 6074 TaxID=1295534 RepID=A0AAX4K039_9TREE